MAEYKLISLPACLSTPSFISAAQQINNYDESNRVVAGKLPTGSVRSISPPSHVTNWCSTNKPIGQSWTEATHRKWLAAEFVSH